jgi:methionine synthase II (cobalamin-independent)
LYQIIEKSLTEKMIDEKIPIEELVEILPASVTYLLKKGIKCIACGEPIWGTLEEAAREKGFGDNDITVFVFDLNELMNSNRT